MVKNLSVNVGDASLIPRSGRSPGVGKLQPTPVFLPGKSHGERRLAGYSPWIAESQSCAPCAVYIAGSCQLSILHMVVYTCQF